MFLVLFLGGGGFLECNKNFKQLVVAFLESYSHHLFAKRPQTNSAGAESIASNWFFQWKIRREGSLFLRPNSLSVDQIG